MAHMDRQTRSWSGDWNGNGPPLVDALKAAIQAANMTGYELECRLTWNLRGVDATYDNLDDARERLSYAKPPKWATVKAFKPRPSASIPESASFDERIDAMRLSETPIIAVEVHVAETQVTVRAEGDNPFDVIPAYEAARKVIERHAVTKVPYQMRDNLPVQSSRWTRTVGWVEKHPQTVGLVVTGGTALAALIGVILGGG
jgi:hypothetical protein